MSSTEAGPPPTVGGGRYTLGDLIGRGGAAEVYRARDELLGRDVAVKLFPAGVGEADESRRQREVQTLAGMNHPGLVTIYDVGQESDRAYFVMQLIEGDSLAERLRSGPLALGDVVALGAALADALTYVHRNGVVHRDIKPGNVLLDGDGRPHLSDFGIAVLADATNITATGMVIGTASYLSPEQVRGQPVGAASDVYALGLVLLECITARREYPGNALEAAVARLHRAPEIPPDLPPQLGNLLVGMTLDEPAERPTTDQVSGELRMLGREVGMDAQTVLAPAPITGQTNAVRTSAMGPGTGPTAYGYPMNGPTQRVAPQGPPLPGPPPQTGPAGAYTGRTQMVGPGATSVGAPPVTSPPQQAPPRRAGRRARAVGIVLALLVVLAGVGFGAWYLTSNRTAAPPAVVPSVTPAPALPAPTSSSEETTRRTTTRRTTEAPRTTTTQAPPPVITTTQAPVTTTPDQNGNGGGNNGGNGNGNGGNNGNGNNTQDSDGDGVPDTSDSAPNNPLVA